MKNYILYILLFFSTLISIPAFAQKEYVGSTQFFDITGEWYNEKTDSTKRISKLNIYRTIVNSYRIVAYYSLGDQEYPAPEASLLVSEREMAYIATILESKCMVMPMIVNGQPKLKVYSIIVNAAGAWLGIAIDYLVKNKSANPSTLKVPISTNKEWEGYWINEWKENQIIPKFQVYRNPDGSLRFKMFRMAADKARLQGEYSISRAQSDGTQIIEWQVGELRTINYFRPIYLGNKLFGVDLIVEEIYTDEAPKGILRQFFVKDPNSEKMVATEKLIKQMEGEWFNTDRRAPTVKVVIAEGEVELWGRCSEKNLDLCSLGKQVIKPSIETDELRAIIPSVVSSRILDIDVNLDINQKYFKDNPAVFTLTSTTEYIDLNKEPLKQTEVFRKKEAIITPQMLNLK